jgi:hypothetical protein
MGQRQDHQYSYQPGCAYHCGANNEERAVKRHRRNPAGDRHCRAKKRHSQVFAEYLPEKAKLSNRFRSQP